MSVIIPKDCFHQPQVADLRLIACPGAEELTNLIDKHLVRWASEAGYQTNSFIIESACPRFQSGDAKGLVKESVRGDDIFIVVDPGNYSVTYKLFNYENHLSPDDHFANLKRLIQAVAGKAHRVSVIMPSLYGGRQHRRVSRESLDCAVALQELQAMGVKNIITFDAHDPRLMNAVPLMSFDNAMPTYQVLKNLLKKNPEISFDKDKFIVVSPDEGAMSRNMYFSSVLGCNLGMFYKRRDYTRVVNGRNPIVAHEYLGDSVEGKTVFVADDIIASGESMLEVATNLKERGAKRIIANATFPLFTSGLEKFDKAVADGILENKYHAYYATKMALWCYLLPNWNINNLKVNPNLTGTELQRAQAILAAAKDIYVRGTAWNKIYSPRVTAAPDRDTAYAVTVDGQQYKQQVFTVHSDTWVCNYAIRVAFSDPASVPAGARIVDMNNKDITTITTSGTGDGYGGKFKVL